MAGPLGLSHGTHAFHGVINPNPSAGQRHFLNFILSSTSKMDASTGTSPKSRAWAFTLNNYTDQEYVSILENSRSEYLVVGKEVGENGTPHLQGYVRFSNAIRLSSLKKILSGRAHFEIAKGSPEQNFKYCTKEGNFEERGDRPSFSRGLEGILHIIDSLVEACDCLDDNQTRAILPDIVNDLGVELADMKCEFDGIDLDQIPQSDDSFLCDEDEVPLTPRIKRARSDAFDMS